MDPEKRQDLDQIIEDLDQTAHKLKKEFVLWRVLMRGVVSGIGATVGAAVVLGLVAAILNQLIGVDVFRPAIERILPYVEPNFGTTREIPTPTYPTPELLVSPSPTPSPETTETPEI